MRSRHIVQKRMDAKLIVIKDWADRGKSLTIWMVLMELINRGANVTWFTYNYNKEESEPVPDSLPVYDDRYDFVAEAEWKGLCIVIISYGDVYDDVDKTLQKALTKQPDYIICAANIKHWGYYTWQLFETKYTNTDYDRVCFWSEHAANKADEQSVKRPTVEAIIKYMQ